MSAAAMEVQAGVTTPGGGNGEAIPAPRIELERGATFWLGRIDEATLRQVTFEKRHPRFGTHPSRLQFSDQDSMPVFLTDEAIAFLAREGSFRALHDADGVVVSAPRDPLSLTDNERVRCLRKKAYVDASLGLGEPHCRMRGPIERAVEALAASRGETGFEPPYTTIRDWIDRWHLYGRTAGIAAFARSPSRPNETPGPVERAVRVGVTMAAAAGGATGAGALEKAQEWLVLNDRDDLLDDLPHLRTFQRRLARLPRITRLTGEYGERFAERKVRVFYERSRPDMPLEEVEVDHTPLDLLVLSDDGETILGRPDVISFRDRHSGCCLGLSIGWEAPSYASFVDGLRHAIYPKRADPGSGIDHPWLCWGRFRKLYVDNAMHFIGLNIQAAASELSFHIAETRPGNPWLKGAQERMFRELNMKVHALPGTTYSNILERRDRKELERYPVLTLGEVTAFLHKWICDDYHVKPHEGLGLLRTMKGVPNEIWKRGVEKTGIPLPPPEQLFISVAGDRHVRAVTGDGIRLSHILYASDDLEAIRNDGRHKDGADDDLVPGAKHTGSRYVVHRDPFDLSHVWVRNPYAPGTPSIKVPAVRQDYAKGLTLHQHLVFVNNADKQLLKDIDADPIDALVEARKRVAQAVGVLQQLRKEQQVERRLARFLWAGQNRAQRSRVDARPIDGEESAMSALGRAERAKAAGPFGSTTEGARKKPKRSAMASEEPRAGSGGTARGGRGHDEGPIDDDPVDPFDDDGGIPVGRMGAAAAIPPTGPSRPPDEPGGFDADAFERQASLDDDWSVP